MEIKIVKISEVKPYYNNPRDNSRAVAPTMESIKRYGFNKPIVLDKNGVIIAGHTRLLAAFRLGLTEVPVVYSDMTEEKAKQLRILDNKLAEKSVYDETELVNELKSLSIPTDMQAFFFEDINEMLNVDFRQFESQFPVSNDFNPGTEEEETDYSPESYDGAPAPGGRSMFGDESEDYQSYGDDDSSSEEESAESNEPGLYRPFIRDGVCYMKVVCPYCGNVEEIEL